MKNMSITNKMLFGICLLFCFVNCISTEERKQLRIIETILNEYPDSALYLLKKMDYRTMNEETKARYSLLKSIALDKSYIDVASDSVINVAVDYYLENGNDHDKMLALYYLSRVKFNAKDYANCIIACVEAEFYALQSRDYFYLGMIYRCMQDVYNRTHNSNEELKYSKLSLDNFSKTKYKHHVDYAMLDVAIALSNKGEYKESLIVLESLKNNRSAISVPYVHILNAYISPLIALNEFSKVKEKIFSLQADTSYSLTSMNYRDLAYCYVHENKIDSAMLFFENARNISKKENNVIVGLRTDYEMCILKKDYILAQNYFLKLMDFQDSIAGCVMNNSVLTIQKNYYRSKNAEIEYKSRLNRKNNILFVVVISVVLLTILLSVHYRYKIKLKQSQKERDLAINDVKDMSNLLDLQQRCGEKMRKQIQELFKLKFEVINNLCSSYFEIKNTPKEQIKIFEEIKTLIENISKEAYVSELISIINKYNDNLIKKINEQLNLGEKDLLLYSYLCAGFSNRSISLLTGDKLENIYNRKSRLKAKIIKSNSIDMELFLSFIK